MEHSPHHPEDDLQKKAVHRSPEELGHMIVGAEAQEKKVQVHEKLADKRLTTSKNIDTMHHSELLELSNRIIIDGSTLRQIYETKLVGEKGLRRLVKAYLEGADVKKSLRQEIVEREIDFERDPGLRDHAPQAAATKTGGKAVTLEQLLKKAALSVEDSQEEVAFIKARAAYEDQEQHQQHRQQHLIDVSLVGIILILLGLIVLLVIRRS